MYVVHTPSRAVMRSAAPCHAEIDPARALMPPEGPPGSRIPTRSALSWPSVTNSSAATRRSGPNHLPHEGDRGNGLRPALRALTRYETAAAVSREVSVKKRHE